MGKNLQIFIKSWVHKYLDLLQIFTKDFGSKYLDL